MTAEAVAGLRKCKVISRYGVGFENVDLDAATAAGIQVTNVPDYCMEDVSDHALALMLSCLRHIPLRDREVREGKWNIQADSFRLKGKTLGVIGAGRIARALIRKVSGFGFAEVVAYDPYISAEQLAEIGVRKVEKEELFRISDIISLHLHANAETNGMICKETLALMKPTAILINVSRGPLVKDEDLLDALRGHRILAAGLDTHNHEPLGAQSPFCQLDNVVLTDHTGLLHGGGRNGTQDQGGAERCGRTGRENSSLSGQSPVIIPFVCPKRAGGQKNMTALERLYNAAVVPVVVLDDAADAVPTAKALLAGGVDVMEITFRTAAAADSIAAVAKECPDMLVGAGTVITLEQCKKAVTCGAKFIVAPGYSEEVVSWCVENDIAITPGCVTPTEIMAAMSHGLKVVKFFPANVYGGLSAMKALSGPFGGIKFIPTGGVNDKNLAEYISAPFIHAVGGSWLCAKADIAAHNFDKITSLCKEARKTALGFEIAHVGVNAGDAEESLAVCRALDAAFGFGVKEGNSSNFAGSGVEVMKSPYLGKNGHIAVKTNSIPRAAAELAKNGFTLDESTAKYKGEKMVAVYLKQEFGGFAVHLLQK